jgi:hypothetical protein
MNIAKNMETIFLSTLIIVGATSFATAAVPKMVHRATAPVAAVAVKADAAMPVVTITAKRLTAAEKAAL